MTKGININTFMTQVKLAGMKWSEVKRKLKKGRCYLSEHGSRHDVWFSPSTGEYFMVSRHDGEEAATGTLKKISNQSGVKL